MLHGGVDVPEMPLKWIGRVNRVGSGRVEHQVDRADRLVVGVRDGEPRVRYLPCRIGLVRAKGGPDTRQRVNNVAPRGADDCLGLGHPRLDERPVPEQNRGLRACLAGREVSQTINGTARERYRGA